MIFTRIQRKSKMAREQYAFWYAIGITGVIALVWVVSLQYRFDEGFSGEIANEEHRGAFSQFMGEAKDNFANIWGAVGTSTDETVGTEEGTEPTATSTSGNSRAPFVFPAATSSEVDEEPTPRRRAVIIETSASTTDEGE